MHTVKIIAAGSRFFAFFCSLDDSWRPSAGMANAAKFFIPLWLLLAGVNMWIGVPGQDTPYATRPRCSLLSSPYPRLWQCL